MTVHASRPTVPSEGRAAGGAIDANGAVTVVVTGSSFTAEQSIGSDGFRTPRPGRGPTAGTGDGADPLARRGDGDEVSKPTSRRSRGRPEDRRPYPLMN
jgi:hypothetical protein